MSPHPTPEDVRAARARLDEWPTRVDWLVTLLMGVLVAAEWVG